MERLLILKNLVKYEGKRVPFSLFIRYRDDRKKKMNLQVK